jgi:outer membrane lipase/esterase
MNNELHSNAVVLRRAWGANMLKNTGLVALAFAFLSTSALAQQRYVAFGDSLSDNGNLFAATGNPPLPYFSGRFSNGPTWVELLAVTPMNRFSPVAPVNNAVSTNFAFGGARTDALVALPPGSGTQIGAYLARGGAFGVGATATLWAGANDIFQQLPIAGGNPATAQAVMQATATAAANNVGAQAGQLAAAGAQTIIVLNLPNFGTLPQFADGPAAGLAGFSSSVFNSVLASSLGAAAAGAPGANLISVDIAGVFNALQASPGSFGFTNAASSCIATLACVTNPAAQNGFAFWDGVHPTAAGHRLVAAVVGQYLNAPVLAGVYSALGENALDERRVGMSRAFDRLDSVRFGQIGVNDYFVNVHGGVSNSDASVTRPGVRSSTYGVNFGLNRALTANWGLAASGSVGLGTLKAGGVLNATTFNAAFDVGAVYTSGVFFAKGGAGLGVTQFSEMERTTIGPLTNRSTATAVAYNAGIEAGTVHGFGMFELSPRARLAWIGGNLGSIAETGIVAPLSIGSRGLGALVAGGELRATAHIVNTAERKISVSAVIGYERYLSHTGNTASARLIGNTARSFRSVVNDARGPGLMMGLGVSSQLSSGWVLTADYRASFGDRNLVRHTGQLGVRASF